MAEDENSQKMTGARSLRRRSGRYLPPEQIPRFHCNVCKRDISRKIRIKCADCADFDLCVECFAVGAEYQDHKRTHRYRVIDDLSFAVFSSSWGADEELLFFDGICGFGIDNWEAVSHFVGSKSPEACKKHYAELIVREKWMDDDSQLPDPQPSKTLAPEAFPFDFDSDEYGQSPQSISSVSSYGVSEDSVLGDEMEDLAGEWLSGSIPTPKSSLAECEGNTSMFTSDFEGNHEVDVSAGDQTTPQTHHQQQQEMELDKSDGNQSLEQGNKSEFEDVMMEQSSSEVASEEDPGEGKKNDSLDMDAEPVSLVSGKTAPGMESTEQGLKRKCTTENIYLPEKAHKQTPSHLETSPGRASRSLSLFDTNAGEVTGYNPFRQEFDPSFDMGAEQMIANLEFFADDPEEVTKAKLKLLNLYRWRVHQREKRTEMLKKNVYGLLDVRKVMSMERQHSWSMNERCADLRAFARFENLQKIETLAKGFFMERTMRKRIHELQEARSLGCRTFSDVKLRHKDSRIPRTVERSNAQLIGKWRRNGHSKLRAPNNLPELTDCERQFCAEVSFSPWQHAVLRDRILREAEEHAGRFSKTNVKTFFRLECSQSVKLFDFFVSKGVFVNSDKDPKESKKLSQLSCPRHSQDPIKPLNL